MSKEKNEVNEEMADLFDKDFRKIKGARYKDMDDSFMIKEKKHHGFIGFIILFLIILGVGYYYFILDNPKTIFKVITDKTLSNINFDDNEIGIDYSFSIDCKSDDEETNKAFDIIKKMKFEGIVGIDGNKRIFNGNIDYKDKRLIDYNFLIDTKDGENVYFKLNNLSDKVVNFKTDTQEVFDYDTYVADYEYIVLSIGNVVKGALEDANYQKTYDKLNGEFVKKMTLKINENFVSKIINKLLQDDKFIDAFGRVYKMSDSEVVDALNEELDNDKNINETMTIYLSILKNEFMKFEYTGDGDKIVVTKDGDKYNYEVIADYEKELDGFVKVMKSDKKNKIILSVNYIEDKTLFEIDLTYGLRDIDSIKALDTKKAIGYQDVSEEDIEEVVDNLTKNEAFLKLLEDLGVDDLSSYIENQNI